MAGAQTVIGPRFALGRDDDFGQYLGQWPTWQIIPEEIASFTID